MQTNGGDLAETTGTNVPGRIGGAPHGVANKAIYNDAFRDIIRHANSLRVAKSVSNQLRFIKLFLQAPDSDADD